MKAESTEILQGMVDKLNETSGGYGLKVDGSRIKFIIVNRHKVYHANAQLQIVDVSLEMLCMILSIL